jgi:hypothetical protein
MLKEIEVEVTAEDIENGFRGSCTSCPVAVAIKRTLKTIPYKDSIFTAVGVNVDSLSIKYYYPYPKLLNIVETPPEAAYFIDCFDTGVGEFGPFKFKVLAPEELIKNC